MENQVCQNVEGQKVYRTKTTEEEAKEEDRSRSGELQVKIIQNFLLQFN